MLGENNVVYGYGSARTTAFDKSTGAILWSYAQPYGYNPPIVNATAGGGVIINNFAPGLVALDANGEVVSISRNPYPICHARAPWLLGGNPQ